MPPPISRRAVSKEFEEIGEELRIGLGNHSMRKTRGYHFYKSTNDIARVMWMLRHSSESVTLRYIGITQDEIDRDFQELEYGYNNIITNPKTTQVASRHGDAQPVAFNKLFWPLRC